KHIQAGVTYLLMQLYKIVYLATCNLRSNIVAFHEHFKANVNVTVLTCLNLGISQNVIKGDPAYSTLGWRPGMEFDWKYIQIITNSHLFGSLYHHICPVLLMHMSVYKGFVREIFVHICSLAQGHHHQILALCTPALYDAFVNMHA
ncbi:Transmembrane protein 147, partial [Galemys pyrenaicus]